MRNRKKILSIELEIQELKRKKRSLRRTRIKDREDIQTAIDQCNRELKTYKK